METRVKEFLAAHPSFTTGEFADMLRTADPDICRASVYHRLKVLCGSGEITRVRNGRYITDGKKDYFYELSDAAKQVVSDVSRQYPLVCFQVWELSQMNEFVNHLLTRKIIFIEVESPLDESVFDLLFDKYPHVLHNPSADEYHRYAGQETIIVRRLITESPPWIGEYRQACLEKLLVDLFGRGITGKIIPHSEYRSIYEDSFRKYNINPAKMFRYAGRRGVEQKVRSLIRDETDIALEEASTGLGQYP